MNMQCAQMEVASLTQFLSLVNYPRVVSGLNGDLLKKRHSCPNPQNLCTLYDNKCCFKMAPDVIEIGIFERSSCDYLNGLPPI